MRLPVTLFLQILLALSVSTVSAHRNYGYNTTISAATAHHHNRYWWPSAAKRTSTDPSNHQLLVGAAGQIQGINFDGKEFTPRADTQLKEQGRTISWMAFKEPSLLYTVDENSNEVRLFTYDPEAGALTGEPMSFEGSPGVVHLAFTQDKQRLLGSSYGKGVVDIWDSSAADGTIRLIKTVILNGAHGPDATVQTQLRAHQAVIDPTGKFVAVNDLGGDMIHILDAASDRYDISDVVAMDPGCGPRHGSFLQLDGGRQATHYAVVCEISSTIHLFSASYSDDATQLTLHHVQAVSTFGPAFPPANAATARAGELLVAQSGAIYVSNRLTGNESDSVSHFALEAKSQTDTAPRMVFKSTVSSLGVGPRMMSWSHGEDMLFIANVDGVNGLVALEKDSNTGELNGKPLGVLPNQAFAPDQPAGQGFGPLFVQDTT